MFSIHSQEGKIVVLGNFHCSEFQLFNPMLLDKTKLVKPWLINIGGRGRGWLVECDIEGVVGKVTPVFKYSQPYLSKIVAVFIIDHIW